MVLSKELKIGAVIAVGVLLWWADLHLRVVLMIGLSFYAFVWWAIRTLRHEREGKFSLPNEGAFHPTHAADNFAIDARTRRVWLRDERGRRGILDAGAIRGWTHHWTERRNGFGHVFLQDNTFQIRTNDIDCPTWIVRFPSHSIAREWHDRLTAFLND